jgi:hypothetical protein
VCRETTSHESINQPFILFGVTRAAELGRVQAGNEVLRSRLAAAEVAGVQAAVADGVLLAEPSEEAFKTQSVAAVGRRTVSKGLC